MVGRGMVGSGEAWYGKEWLNEFNSVRSGAVEVVSGMAWSCVVRSGSVW